MSIEVTKDGRKFAFPESIQALEQHLMCVEETLHLRMGVICQRLTALELM